MYIKSGGSWKSIQGFYIKVSGAWKVVIDGYIKVSGVWKRFWATALSIAQTVQIAQSTNATTFLTTLTGTNYHWSPGPAVLTYKFQRSTDNQVTWTDLDSGSITDPAYGSSNTKTYLLPATGPNIGVLPNVLNYYRFRVDATYGTLSASSISSSTTIQGPTNTTISLANPAFGSVELSWTASTGANRYLVYKSTDNSIFSEYASTTSTSIFGISDLTGGNTYYFYVVPVTGGSFTYPGYYGNNSNTLTLPILATPTLSSSTSQSGGFYFTIENYNASNTYNLSTTSGSVSRSGNTVTVSGLSEGASATVTVGATRSGYGSSNTATRSGTAAVSRTVTWDANGGSVSPTSQTVLSGTSVTAPTPTRTHYTFLYWRNPLSGGDPIILYAGNSYTVTADITFYAIWNANTYTVSYNYNGGTGSPSSASVQYPGSVTLPTPDSRTGYSFNGWYTASSGGTFVGNAGSSYSPTSNITLYAQWTQITYTITWNANGGSVSPTSNSGTYGQTVTAPTPTRSGYTFLYWRDTVSGDFTYSLNAGATWTIIGSITFYARWSINQYTVTYNANGGSVSPTSATVNAGSSVTLPTPTRSGYTFNGWYDSSSGGNYLGGGGSTYTPGSSITIYAQWSIIQYTVTWNANGGSVSPSSNTVNAGSSVTAPTPTRSGFTFLYWRDTPSGDFTYSVNAGASFTPPSSITMYARWQASATPPATPTGFSIGGSGFAMWDASSGATSYTLEWYAARNSTGTLGSPAVLGPFTYSPTVTSQQITYPTSGGFTYNYVRGRVRANNSAGSSAYTAWYPSSTTYV